MSGIQNDSQRQPALADSMRGLPPGWTASEWSEVVRTVHADLLGSPPHAPLADPWTQRVKLIAEDADTMVGFGSVAMDGDTLVVGAAGGRVWDAEDNKYYYCGTVYVFERSASDWSHVHQTAKLYPEDYKHVEGFGGSVAIDGYFIVVGAPGTWVPFEGTHGAAYLFMHTVEGWKQTSKLTKLSLSEGSDPRFGVSVDIDGDLIVVGAPMEDLFYDGYWHRQQGSAYVFQMPVGGWPGSEAHESGFLWPSDGRAGDAFGASVAVNDNTVIVGAYAHEPDPDNPDEIAYGKAYIFTTPDGIWGNTNDVAQFTASDAADHEYFGMSVAIDGDLAAVGAWGSYAFDANGEESVYLFERPETGWSGSYTETARLVASDDDPYHQFGGPVEVSGNVVVVSAQWNNVGRQSKAGSVYVFVEPAGGWVDMMTETQKLLADDHAAGDQFGSSLAMDGTAIAVGVPLDNGHYGSVYMFDSAPVQLDSVSITEPVLCGVNTGCLFSATASPLTASQPITYVWQATGQSVVTHTGRGITDSLNLTWNMTGTQSMSVTATNALNTVDDSHLINVARLSYVYLPLVLR